MSALSMLRSSLAEIITEIERQHGEDDMFAVGSSGASSSVNADR